MNLDDLRDDLIGAWTGDNLLRLSWMTPTDYPSASELKVTTAVREKFLAFSYRWSHENQPHEGLLLVGYDAKQELVNASWADSWHSSDKPLALAGKINAEKIIELHGAYAVPNSSDWGWKIVIAPSGGDVLQIRMYNCSPEGVEDLAVQADYQRAN